MRGIHVSHKTLRQWNIKFASRSPKNAGIGNPNPVPCGFWTRSASRSAAGTSGCGGLLMTRVQSSTCFDKLGEILRQHKLFLDDC